MENTVEIPATLTAFGAPPRTATATVVPQTPPQRLARALGTFWGLALIGLFIPLAHLILVLTFLTAGIVVAVPKAREDQRLVKVRGACPRCGIDQAFVAYGRFTRERSIVCPHCHDALRLLAISRVLRVD